MSRSSKKTFESTKTTVDHTTGEILESSKTIVRQVNRDHFIKLFFEDLTRLFQISQPVHLKVLLCVTKYVAYETNKVTLLKGLKEDIAKEIGCSPKSVDNAITYLCNKSILVKIQRAIYVLNPKYFFKGEETDKAKVVKLILEYQFKD